MMPLEDFIDFMEQRVKDARQDWKEGGCSYDYYQGLRNAYYLMCEHLVGER